MKLYIKIYKNRLRRLIRLSNRRKSNIMMLGFILGIIFAESLITIAFLIILGLLAFKPKIILLFVISLLLGIALNLQYYSKIAKEKTLLTDSEAQYEFLAIENGRQSDFSQVVTVQSENFKSLVVLNLPVYPRILAGERLLVEVTLENVENYSKHESYVNYLKSKGINFSAEAFEYQVIEGNELLQFSSHFNNKLNKSINKNVSHPESALASGLVTGNTEYFSEDFEESLKATGTSHIAAVSGFNMLLVYMSFLSFSGFIPRKILILTALFFVILYLFIVGFTNLPAQRATITVSILAVSSLIGRKNSSITALLISACFMLITYPPYANNVSFQLSMSATAGILLFSKKISKLLSFIKPKSINEILSTTLTATIFTAPISTYHFGETSSIGVITNLLVLPLVPVSTVIGILASLFSGFSVAKIGFTIVEKINWLILKMIELVDTNLGFLNNEIKSTHLLISLLIILIYLDFKNLKRDKSDI